MPARCSMKCTTNVCVSPSPLIVVEGFSTTGKGLPAVIGRVLVGTRPFAATGYVGDEQLILKPLTPNIAGSLVRDLASAVSPSAIAASASALRHLRVVLAYLPDTNPRPSGSASSPLSGHRAYRSEYKTSLN